MQTINIFYQLPQISSQPPCIKWSTLPELQKYIENLNTPHVDQIAYHLVTSPPNPITTDCLTACLAHIVLNPPYRLKSTHTLLQQHYTEDLSDLYQIGLEIISQPHSFLSNFDPTKSLAAGYWYPSFYNWSQLKFDRLLTDKIRNQKGMGNFRRTNLSLISRATPTKITKALHHQGHPPTTHATYLTIHHCLSRAVKAKRFNTANPQPTDYAEIFALYQKQPVIPLDQQQIISHLETLGKAIRNYDQLNLQSIDRPLRSDSNQTQTLSDIIPAPQTPLETIIDHEYQQQVNQLKNIVIQQLQQLPPERNHLLFLMFGLQLNQAKTGLELQVHQVTAKKRYDKTLTILAQATYRQTRDKSPPTSFEQLQPLITHLAALCQEYYSDFCTTIIQQFIDRDLLAIINHLHHHHQIQLLPDGPAITKLQKLHTM
jgi:DNA-directed RNA polymerase specialized sigma24 family protein